MNAAPVDSVACRAELHELCSTDWCSCQCHEDQSYCPECGKTTPGHFTHCPTNKPNMEGDDRG